MPAPLDQDLRNKIHELSDDGHTATSAGKRLGVGRHTAARYMTGAGGRKSVAPGDTTEAASGPNAGITFAAFSAGEIEHLHWIAKMTVRSTCSTGGKPVLHFRGHEARGRCLWCHAEWAVGVHTTG